MTDKPAAEIQLLYWDPAALVMPLGRGLIRLFHVHVRRNILTTLDMIQLIDRLTGGLDRPTLEKLYDQLGPGLKTADATTFTLWDHAYNNSDFFDQSLTSADLEHLSFEEFLDLMLESGFISAKWPPEYNLKKESFADRFKGSFYEQIGTECLFQRCRPVDWWVSQKFEPDLAATRKTPYRFIQDRFLEDYFARRLAGKEVLEIGCGTGYYTRKMAAHAARAVGLDYNPDYIQAARDKWLPAPQGNLEFHVGDIIDLSAGAGIFQDLVFDAVILIDTFLFLFDEGYQAELARHRDAIMTNLVKLLKADGLLIIMDPHPFWLTPWLGPEEKPFGLLTEYRHRTFKVIPTLEEMTSFLYEHGLRVRRILEPDISPDYRAVDAQAYHFMHQFPQWWVFEAEKALNTAKGRTNV